MNTGDKGIKQMYLVVWLVFQITQESDFLYLVIFILGLVHA
jgi:hypothetical protein